jgi:hypothetical protein
MEIITFTPNSQFELNVYRAVKKWLDESNAENEFKEFYENEIDYYDYDDAAIVNDWVVEQAFALEDELIKELEYFSNDFAERSVVWADEE